MSIPDPTRLVQPMSIRAKTARTFFSLGTIGGGGGGYRSVKGLQHTFWRHFLARDASLSTKTHFKDSLFFLVLIEEMVLVKTKQVFRQATNVKNQGQLY